MLHTEGKLGHENTETSLIFHHLQLLFRAGHVAADTDSAEDVADDPEAAIDEEDDDGDEMLVEEDQMRPTVCVLRCVTDSNLTF